MDEAKSWIMSYAAINLDGADIQIREHKGKGTRIKILFTLV